ncbi:tetratricopeptide repeat protein [Algiphilus sp.]|uniref:tetratricopeptide repeat protein n=1 Tax=Algiphilus sp. TaxID=1872431 RepID=UPI0025C4A6ED|nr:tetratricopeptide repeat protein [Algiphilus sp.]MCK5770997.1 tetratricopeptide repeat protein [Algiphilus sp.]
MPRSSDGIGYRPRAPRAVVFALLVAIAAGLQGCASGGSQRPAGDRDPGADRALSAADRSKADRYFQEALALMRDGRRDEARGLLRSLADAYPTLSGPLTNLGILEARGNQQQVALQHFREAVRTNPENAVAHNWLGILYREQGDYARAEEAYRRAIALHPDYAIAYRNLGVLYDVYLERPEAALAAYRAYLERGSEDDLIVRVWVRELEARGISAPPRSLAITGGGA